MAWDSWSAFWAMGGYGLYVWAAYLLALMVVVAEIVVLVLSRRSILDHLGLTARGRRKDTSAPDDETPA